MTRLSTIENGIIHLSNTDNTLALVIKNYPPPNIKQHENYYAELVSSIISQQLSVKAAATIQKRFCELFGGAKIPTPEKILAAETDYLCTAGLSRAKALYVQDLAQKTLAGEIDFNQFPSFTNEQIIKELVAVKGIGEWTAHMFLIFCMGRLDILPVGDLGIKNGITKLYRLDHQATPEDIKNIATKYSWHPYESVASWYIWKSLG